MRAALSGGGYSCPYISELLPSGRTEEAKGSALAGENAGGGKKERVLPYGLGEKPLS